MRNFKEIYLIFFPKTFSDKYSHIGYSYPAVPSGWVDIVEKAIIDIEKVMWPQKYLPMFIKRLIHYLATGNSIVRIKYMFFYNLRTRLTKGQMITTIKDKFAQLRIYGYNGYEIEEIISDAEKNCEQTCENCGSNDDVNVVGERWLMNLCINCKTNG